MLEVKDVNVFNLEESIVASGFPMSTGELENDFEEHVWCTEIYLSGIVPKSEEDKRDSLIGKKHFDRAKKLANTPSGSGHSTFLTGIRVTFNLKYPEYISPQLQRYHWLDIVSSNSKMHRLTKMDIRKSVNKYVDDVVIDNLNKWIDLYNNFPKGKNFVSTDYEEVNYVKDIFEVVRKDIQAFDWLSKYEVFMKIISNCPLGLEKWTHISTNYQQLKTIYSQRKNHKLEEDYLALCDMIRELPCAKDFITGGE